MKNNRKIIALCFCMTLLMSCVSQEEALRRLSPPRSLAEIQISDIEAMLPDRPEAAIHAIGRFRWRYLSQADEDSPRFKEVLLLEERARLLLYKALETALEEARWHDAASLFRSTEALDGILRPDEYYHLLIRASRASLAGDAFLSASLWAREALAFEKLPNDLLLDLFTKAVDRKERRSAFWLLSLLEASGDRALVDSLPSESLAFARMSDSPAEMIKGVATVWVDRGLKIEQGTATLDRVIGSAFFISSDGLLVTNHHVISSLVDPSYEGFARLYIRMGSSSSPRIPAKVIGWDPLMDLAVIQAQIQPDYVFSLLDTAPLNVGSQILAIGSPAGFEKTVTQGIVSATGRRLLQIGDVFQLDAAVNQGNSGGPALDLNGRLTGVVFAGVPSFQGLNFAVSATRLADAVPAMLRGGEVKRPWIGLSLNETARGLESIYVAPGTPAASQAIPEGVFLGAVRSAPVPREDAIVAVQDRIFSCAVGELVRLDFTDGSSRVLALDARPEMPLEMISRLDSRERALIPLFGLVLSWVRSGVFSTEYHVARVMPGSIAEEAGISEHDSLSIIGYNWDKNAGYGILDLRVKRRKAGYIEASIRIPVSLRSNDLL